MSTAASHCAVNGGKGGAQQEESAQEENKRLSCMSVKQELVKSLRDIAEKAASPTTYGIFTMGPDAFVDPEIHVDGHRIRRPATTLPEEDVNVIASASHRALADNGYAAALEGSVKSWELRFADFEIRNPKWVNFLQQVLRKVALQNGVSEEQLGFRAELQNN